MNEEALRQQLQKVSGDDPSPEFVDGLRRRLSENPHSLSRSNSLSHSNSLSRSHSLSVATGDDERVTVLDLDRRPGQGAPPRSRVLWPVVAAAVLLLGLPLLVRAIAGGERELGTAATTEARQVGEAWLQSIVDDDRETFVALHSDVLQTDDTLMGFSEDVGLLTATRISELYYGGFDALQAALKIDGDVIRSDGCEDADDEVVRCGFTATMIGTADYRYTVMADLTIEDRLIIAIDFSTTTEPANFRSVVEEFLDDEGTDEDRSCLTLGFNTTGCGEHESDFLTRYAAYYESTRG